MVYTAQIKRGQPTAILMLVDQSTSMNGLMDSGKTKAQVLGEFGGQGFGAFKPALADLTVSVMGPVGARMREYLDDPAELDATLMKGALRARAIAAPVLDETKKLVGFWRA